MYIAFVAEQLEGLSDPKVFVEQKVDCSRFVPDCSGTCDALIISDGILHIVDLKYGRGVKVDAEGNDQLRIYALGTLEMLGFLYPGGICAWRARNEGWHIQYSCGESDTQRRSVAMRTRGKRRDDHYGVWLRRDHAHGGAYHRELEGISGRITLDDPLMEAYSSAASLNSNMSGDSPTLAPGDECGELERRCDQNRGDTQLEVSDLKVFRLSR